MIRVFIVRGNAKAKRRGGFLPHPCWATCYATTRCLTKLADTLSSGQIGPNRPYFNGCDLSHGMRGRHVDGFFEACALYQFVGCHFFLGLSEWTFFEHNVTFAHPYGYGIAGRPQRVSILSDSPSFHFLVPSDDLRDQSLSWSKGIIVADNHQVLHVVSPQWHNAWHPPRAGAALRVGVNAMFGLLWLC